MTKRNGKEKCSQKSDINKEEVFIALEQNINVHSKNFSSISRQIVLAVIGSIWVTIFTTKNSQGRFLLFVALGIGCFYLFVELLYCLAMERVSRKLHIGLEKGQYNEDEVEKIWNEISDKVSNILLLKMVLIIAMLVVFVIYLSDIL